MADIQSSIFVSYLLFLFVPFILAYLCRRLHISSLFGYLLGGILLSSFFSNYINAPAVDQFATFGIMLLLFTTGMQMNYKRIMELRKFIVLGGVIQLCISIISLTFFFQFFGFNIFQSIFIAVAFSYSSTALIVKILQERGEEATFLGELVAGILLFQDLTFIPVIYVISLSSSSTKSDLLTIFKNISITTIFTVLLLWLLNFAGKKIIPSVFDHIAHVSRDLFSLFIILFILTVAYGSVMVGLPVYVSLFIAGLLLSQSVEQYHIFTQIKPLRDIFVIIFFVYIGLSVKLDTFIHLFPQIILLSIGIILIKFIAGLISFTYLRFNTRLAFYLSVFLFQLSEDAFILLSVGMKHSILSSDQYVLTISAVMVTLLLTPFFVENREKIYFSIRGFLHKYAPKFEQYLKHSLDAENYPLNEIQLKNHVVICGYGRIGSEIGKALHDANIPFIAIDYNFHVAQSLKKIGMPVVYGDPADKDILDFAQVDKARVLVVAVPDRYSQEAIILNARQLNPRIFIITRAHGELYHQRMKDLGAQLVVQPEIEASQAILNKVYVLMKSSH